MGWSSLWMTSSAYALNFAPVVGYVLPSAQVTLASGSTAGFAAGGIAYGALFDFLMTSSLYTEIGGIFAPRGFSLGSTQVTFNTFMIPLLLRVYLIPSFSVGLGAYFSHGYGPVSKQYTYRTSQAPYGADDYGAVFSAMIRIGLLRKVSLIIDGRYLLGIQNINQSGSDVTSLRDIQILSGIRYGL